MDFINQLNKEEQKNHSDDVSKLLIINNDNSLCYVNFTIAVQDFGEGMPEDKIDKIFHAFGKLKDKNNLNVEGRGLGLSIVQ